MKLFGALGILGTLCEMGMKELMWLVAERLHEVEWLVEKFEIDLLHEMVILAGKQHEIEEDELVMMAEILFLIPEVEEEEPVVMLHLHLAT